MHGVVRFCPERRNQTTDDRGVKSPASALSTEGFDHLLSRASAVAPTLGTGSLAERKKLQLYPLEIPDGDPSLPSSLCISDIS